MRKKVAGSSLSVPLLVAAGVVSALAVMRYINTRSPEAGAPSSFRIIDNWQPIAQAGHSNGPSDATVTIIEFSDFECSFSARLQQILGLAIRSHATDVRLVFRHFPLERIHVNAIAAALASECAADQNAFDQYKVLLFDEHERLSSTDYATLAVQIALDSAAFGQCVRDKRHIERVRDDIATARRIGVEGTPTLIVNGVVIRGLPEYDVLTRVIQEAMK